MPNITVTKDQIQELPRKYAIGKRPLSKVLGWGELTYTRILEGSKPSEEHARDILRALEDPVMFSMLLENANKKGILSPLCYERCRKAVDGYITEDEAATGIVKMHEVGKALCVLTEGEATCRAIQLLIYFANGKALQTKKEPILDQLPVASDFGPAYPELDSWFTYERIQECAGTALEAIDLDPIDLEILKETVEEYGIYSRRGLQQIACSQSPWKKARKKTENPNDNPPVITLKSMKKHFTK